MKTEPKQLLFPGAHGQAAYCCYQIALTNDVIRPKIMVLLSHEQGYRGASAVNNQFSCDYIVNKILSNELSGLNLADVEFYFHFKDELKPDEIHLIPFQLNWEPELSFAQKVRIRMGETLTFYSDPELSICGNSMVETGDNVRLENEEKELISELFDLSNELEKTQLLDSVEA